MSCTITVRRRRDADVAACVDIAHVVQARDAYPPHPPRELERFVRHSGALGAWVAELDTSVVGHVALHPSSSDEAMALALAVTGSDLEGLSVVSRLFVHPEARGRGVGGRLLEAATGGAHAIGRRPILDVATHFAAAIAVYERAGWVRVGEVKVDFRDMVLSEFVYLGPEVPVIGGGRPAGG